MPCRRLNCYSICILCDVHCFNCIQTIHAHDIARGPRFAFSRLRRFRGWLCIKTVDRRQRVIQKWVCNGRIGEQFIHIAILNRLDRRVCCGLSGLLLRRSTLFTAFLRCIPCFYAFQWGVVERRDGFLELSVRYNRRLGRDCTLGRS